MNESFEYKEAALPNIYGEASWTYLGYLGYHYFMGAINYTPEVKLRGTSGWTAGADLGSNYTLIFNASEYNSIYKDDCITVQPSSFCLMYIMKVK